MGEEVTNTAVTETQTAAPAAEENVGTSQEPQVNQQETVDTPAENSNKNEVEEKQGQQGQEEQPKQPTVEELQAKLNEYQVREEEDRMIREQLGIKDIDQQTYNYMNIDQQIVNEGKQVYLRLCNEYGIDANPNKIDASIEELKKTDPAKAYEFQKRFEGLSNEVINKRNAVQQQNAYYEVNKFEQDYSPILHASPALYNIMSQYVQNYSNTGDMYGQLKGVMDTIMPAYQEAFNAGRQYALKEKAEKDTSQVSGGIATDNTQTYTGNGTTFTRDQIKRMSTEEFTKYEKEIMRQMREGRIQ